MSNSPVKIIGAAAGAASGRGSAGSNTMLSNVRDITAGGDEFGVFFGGLQRGKKKRALRQERRLKRDQAKKLQESGMSRNRQMFMDATRQKYIASGEVPGSIVSATQPATALNPEVNNTIDNTVSAAQDRSQMRDTGELTGVAGPAGFSTMSSAVLDPMSQVAPTVDNNLQPQVPTYGVAGAAENMFGTPMQRQMSMGSSLMKRAYKYKNKK